MLHPKDLPIDEGESLRALHGVLDLAAIERLLGESCQVQLAQVERGIHLAQELYGSRISRVLRARFEGKKERRTRSHSVCRADSSSSSKRRTMAKRERKASSNLRWRRGQELRALADVECEARAYSSMRFVVRMRTAAGRRSAKLRKARVREKVPTYRRRSTRALGKKEVAGESQQDCFFSRSSADNALRRKMPTSVLRSRWRGSRLARKMSACVGKASCEPAHAQAEGRARLTSSMRRTAFQTVASCRHSRKESQIRPSAAAKQSSAAHLEDGPQLRLEARRVVPEFASAHGVERSAQMLCNSFCRQSLRGGKVSTDLRTRRGFCDGRTLPVPGAPCSAMTSPSPFPAITSLMSWPLSWPACTDTRALTTRRYEAGMTRCSKLCSRHAISESRDTRNSPHRCSGLPDVSTR